MNRRAFAKVLLTSSAWLSPLVRSALADTAAPSLDPGLAKEVDAVLQKEFFIDNGWVDRFTPYGNQPPPKFDPVRLRKVVGGGVLGTGGPNSRLPTFLPKNSLMRTQKDYVVRTMTGNRHIFDGPTTVERMLGEFELIHRAVEAHPTEAGLAVTAREMEAIMRAGKLAVVIGVDNGSQIDSNLMVLEEYYRLGMRRLSLVCEDPPPWAECAWSETGQGLHPFGRDVVAECNRLGIMVDVSHSSDLTFWGAVKCCKRPITASHSGARGVSRLSRNLTDEMLKAVADTGGIIGVAGVLDQKSVERWKASGLYNNLLMEALWMEKKYPEQHELAAAWETPEKHREARQALGLPEIPESSMYGTVGLARTRADATLEQLDYIVRRIGFDYVGIGTDHGTNADDYPELIRLITGGLIQRRYSEEQIRKVLNGNFLRVFQANEAVV